LIQSQLKHFQLQKFRFTSKNILSSDKNVRTLRTNLPSSQSITKLLCSTNSLSKF